MPYLQARIFRRLKLRFALGRPARVFCGLSAIETMANMTLIMFFEFLRLLLGFVVAAFHRPIADYIMEHERVLVIAFRQRGIPAPVLTAEAARNVYFGLGMFIVALEMARIWGLSHPQSAWFLLVGR